MARTALRPPSLVRRYFRGSAAVRRGLLTPNQLHGPAWRRLFRDVYVDADVPLTHELRCHAAELILPAGAAITGPLVSDGIRYGFAFAPAAGVLAVAAMSAATLGSRNR